MFTTERATSKLAIEMYTLRATAQAVARSKFFLQKLSIFFFSAQQSKLKFGIPRLQTLIFKVNWRKKDFQNFFTEFYQNKNQWNISRFFDTFKKIFLTFGWHYKKNKPWSISAKFSKGFIYLDQSTIVSWKKKPFFICSR